MDILFHTHTEYSLDSMIKLDAYRKKCQQLKVVPCITDHNTIEGALAYRKRYGKNSCIVGEEIMTGQGEVIGLFMKKHVQPKLSVEETIKQLKAQHSLILVPHPFDRMRHSRINISKSRLTKLDVDFIEIFNSRTLHEADNVKAERFAKENNYLTIVGADSHFISEMNNSVNIVKDFDVSSPEQFRKAFAHARFKKNKSGLLPHAGTKIVKLLKKH